MATVNQPDLLQAVRARLSKDDAERTYRLSYKVENLVEMYREARAGLIPGVEGKKNHREAMAYIFSQYGTSADNRGFVGRLLRAALSVLGSDEPQ